MAPAPDAPKVRTAREDAQAKRDEELDSAYLYRQLAASESDPRVRALFAELAGAAERQAAIWVGALDPGAGSSLPAFQPGLRTRIVARIARRVGARRMRPMLAAMKVRGLSVWSVHPPAAHGQVHASEYEGARHRAASQGSNLRAVVFGVSDGIVSNVSLILGVSGASADPRTLVIAGVAGLLAGASSMAAGEYVSVRSQRELFEHQIGLERDELAQYPEEEQAELAMIYRARGLSDDEAQALAKALMADPERALDTLARDELGLDPASLGSPWSAASYSFLAFAMGAVLPLLPLLLCSGPHSVYWSAGVAFVALFAVGAALSLFTGRNALYSGARLAAIGAAAALVTYGIGRAFGVAV